MDKDDGATRVEDSPSFTNDDAITDGGLIDKTIDKVRMLHVFINFLKLIICAHLFLISN
jgi:hypothetical protein